MSCRSKTLHTFDGVGVVARTGHPHKEQTRITIMNPTPFSSAGKSFEIHEWRGSGPANLHVHHADDEA